MEAKPRLMRYHANQSELQARQCGKETTMEHDKLWQAEKIMEAWRNGKLYGDLSEVRREKRRLRRLKRREMEENNRMIARERRVNLDRFCMI